MPTLDIGDNDLYNIPGTPPDLMDPPKGDAFALDVYKRQVDDCVCSIGTANMDIRSFELNFEINAFMYSSEVAKKQRAIFENDILKSKEITLDMYNSCLLYTS